MNNEAAPEAAPKKTREIILARIQSEIEALQARAVAVRALPASFDELTLPASVFGGFVDFDNLNHEDIIKVIKAVGGRWDKTPSATTARIDYQTKTESGANVRCWAGEPPPNCKIEEVLETVPAQPERIVTVRKLVCK